MSPTPFGAHALLITRDGNVILQQKTHDYSFNPLNQGKLSMYGGGSESDEKPLETLRRELKEELQLELDERSIRELNTYRKNQEQDGIVMDVHVFVLNDVDPNALSVDATDDIESSTEFVLDTVDTFLKNPNISRITKLALLDYKVSL